MTALPDDLSAVLDDDDATSEHVDVDDDYDAQLLGQLVDWETFWEADHAEEEWMARPIIAAKRSHAIYAPGGTGKSLFALWLAAKLVTGANIFGNPHQRRRILYLDYEMTEDDLADRLDSIGIESADALTHLHYALLPSLPSADKPEGGKAICRLAQLVGADLVIIDTFSRAVEGDENDADTVRSFYRWTGIHLKAAGIAFVRIDHSGKDLAKGQRGSSAKNDDVDIVWEMRVVEGGFKLTAKKRRMGWVPETITMTQTDGPLEYDMADRPGYPTGTSDIVTTLDKYDIDPKLGYRKAATELRAKGVTPPGSTMLRAAVRFRRERLMAVEIEPFDSAESAPGAVQAHPAEIVRPTISGAPDGNAHLAGTGAVQAHPGAPNLSNWVAPPPLGAGAPRTDPDAADDHPVDNPEDKVEESF
jgi:hypothetical protein